MKIKKQFQGMGKHRYASDPLEKRFAEAWQTINSSFSPSAVNAKSTLDYLMDESNKGIPDPQLSQRDWLVANTAIQWLGSPVGQFFLSEVLSGPEAMEFRERLGRAVEDREKKKK